MKWLTIKEVAALTGLSDQTVRKKFPVTKFGHSVRIWESDVTKYSDRRVLTLVQGDPGLSLALQDYRSAELTIEYMDPNPDAIADRDMASLLVSTLATIRLVHPEWGGHVIGVDAVFPPVLVFLKANLPQGGGAKGEALRELILAA